MINLPPRRNRLRPPASALISRGQINLLHSKAVLSRRVLELLENANKSRRAANSSRKTSAAVQINLPRRDPSARIADVGKNRARCPRRSRTVPCDVFESSEMERIADANQ